MKLGLRALHFAFISVIPELRLHVLSGDELCVTYTTMAKLTLISLCLLAVKLVFAQDYDDNHAKVLIIGAGAAGLQAAKEFHDQSMNDLIIIEAANSYGGRVHDITFAGMQVEAGANWAQPPDTEIIDTVKRLSIAYHVADYDSVIIRNASGHDVSEGADLIWVDMEQAVKKLVDIGSELNKQCRRDMSIGAALRLAGWKPTTPIHKAIEFYEFDLEWSDIPSVTSLKSTTPLLVLDSDTLYVTDQGGFKRIFEEITPWLMMDPYKNHLRLNKTVVSIVDKSSNGVEVRCSDGTTYTGDYALVTVSLGVLQNDVIDFQPALPEWKIVKFFQFIMASFAKIFMKFPIQFWENKEWILHASERRGYFPVFLNLNSTGTFPADPNILVSFVTGDEARRIQNQPLAETKAEVEAVMRNMYPNAGVPEATHIYVTDWDTNPLFYGAYSNWPVEVSTEGFEQIQSRVGNIFFAGEHTDPMFNGYIIGATRSGVREASKILSCMKGEECPAYEPPKSYSCPSSGNIATLSFTAALIAALFHSFTAL